MDNCCSTDLDGVFTKLGPRRNLPLKPFYELCERRVLEVALPTHLPSLKRNRPIFSSPCSRHKSTQLDSSTSLLAQSCSKFVCKGCRRCGGHRALANISVALPVELLLLFLSSGHNFGALLKHKVRAGICNDAANTAQTLSSLLQCIPHTFQCSKELLWLDAWATAYQHASATARVIQRQSSA